MAPSPSVTVSLSTSLYRRERSDPTKSHSIVSAFGSTDRPFSLMNSDTTEATLLSRSFTDSKATPPPARKALKNSAPVAFLPLKQRQSTDAGLGDAT